MWTVIPLGEIESWLLDLARDDPGSADQVEAAVDPLADQGPALGRPVIDRVKGSWPHNLREPRPGSSGGSEVRMLFVFDAEWRAIMLVAGDKAGAWHRWYRDAIPLAERRYGDWLAGRYHIAE